MLKVGCVTGEKSRQPTTEWVDLSTCNGSFELPLQLSDRLHVVTIDAHSHRPLNGMDGNNQAVVAVFGQENAFHPVHSTAAYPHPLDNLEKGAGAPRRRLRQNLLNTFDLIVGNRQAGSASAYKTVHIFQLIHTRPVFRTQSAANKYIAAEERHFDFLLAIAPAMHLHRGRDERSHALLAQPPLDHPFVARSGVQRIPAQLWLRSKLAQAFVHFANLT